MMQPPIDVFAHVLAPNFYQKMLAIDPSIPEKAPYVNAPALTDMQFRHDHMQVQTQQIISMMNLNPEDFTDPQTAFDLCTFGNAELETLVTTHPDQFIGAVAMLPLNNPDGVTSIMRTIATRPHLLGIQLFTRALGESIADPAYDYIFKLANELSLPIWLHPVFDDRKPDNNIVFSWEYELSLAMQQLVSAGIIERYPALKIIVHHAGAMVPFFSGRINAILPADQAAAFHQFYVDTAILGNPTALKLTVEFFGADHVFFGTDAPLGLPPVGASQEIIEAITTMTADVTLQNQILFKNVQALLNH